MNYTGPRCRLCRREGKKLFLKGDRCFSQKCPITQGAPIPGQHAKKAGKLTEYGVQLREKQKAKRIYNLSELQFVNYYKKASGKKGVDTSNYMFQLIELRLDNVVYRSGLARSRHQARQMVAHGLITVNGQPVTIPSIQMHLGDAFAVNTASQDSALFQVAKQSREDIPSWLELDRKSLRGSIVRPLESDDLPHEFNPQLIVEFYSR